jgi:hypothetical protein
MNDRPTWFAWHIVRPIVTLFESTLTCAVVRQHGACSGMSLLDRKTLQEEVCACDCHVRRVMRESRESTS